MLYELKCKNCNGALNPKTLKCEYCGSQYREKNDNGRMVYIQTCPAKTEVLMAQVSVPDELVMRDAEGIAKHTLNEMSNLLAEELIKFVKFEKEYDIHTMTQIIRGTVRVVEPDFRF